MRPTDPRLLRRLRPGIRPLAGVIGAGVLSSLLLVAQAWAVAGLVVAMVHGSDLRPWGVGVVVVFGARGVVGLLSDVAAAHAAGAVGTAVRRDLMRAVLAGSAGSAATGETAVLVTRGVAAAEPYLTRYLPALVLAAVLPPLTVIAIATQDLLSAVIVLATVPLIPVFGALVGLATRDRAERQWGALESLSGHFLDVMRGLPTLVAFRRAEAQTRRIRAVTERYRRASLATLRLAFASSAVLELVATLSVALVAVTVGVRLASGHLDLRTALVVLLLAPEAYWPLRRVGAEFHAAAEGVATFERVEALLGDPSHGPTAPPPNTGDLVVDHVTVHYPGRRMPALDAAELRIPARGLTAITGPSGCGKSTLLAVLAGLREPDQGTVCVDGAPVEGEAWRSQVALLPQRPVFVAGTIADNVRLGAPTAEEPAVWRALRQVALEERIRALPRGLDTALGEDGATLSAGERARLALARIVLADRPWVLLDEPTAHLDPVTERVVSDTLSMLAHDRGVVVVAHRESLVRLARHVVALPSPAGRHAPSGHASTVSGAGRAVAIPGVEAARAPGRMAWPAALGTLASTSGVALAATSGWLIVQAAARPAVLTLLVAIVGVRTFGIARPLLRYAERLSSHDRALRILAARRAAVYDALVPLTPARLGPRRGDVLASVVDDVDNILDRELRDRLPMRGLVGVGALSALIAGAVDLRAGLMVAGIVTVALLGYVGVRAVTARTERGLVLARAALSERVVEITQVADELTMWQAGRRAVRDVETASRRLMNRNAWTALAAGTGRAVLLAVGGLTVSLTALLIAPRVTDGTLSAPSAALLVLIPLALIEVVVPVADSAVAGARATAAEERLATLLDQNPAVVAPVDPARPSQHTGVELVRTSADWDGVPVLRDLSVRVPEGGRVAVVGESGSGKSTLAALLIRFLDPSSGSVRLGGVGLHRLALNDVRSSIGLVDDDPHVFATSVAENVRLSRPGADDGDVQSAIRRAGLGDWLDDLDDGLATRLGDGAAEISGGERARLAVARSILADQHVLVLDEPVAHLDHASAALLAGDLLREDEERTIVWITHEPIGLDRVDAIVTLDHPRTEARTA